MVLPMPRPNEHLDPGNEMNINESGQLHYPNDDWVGGMKGLACYSDMLKK